MMSLVKPLNEKERVNKTLKEIRAGDSLSSNKRLGSQKDIVSVMQLHIDVYTYKSLLSLAQSQGVSVEELVANAIVALAGENACEQ
ncbi:MAG: hypothetical protein IJ985_07630 [Akkermansia sp.]|nr:hypothetical protein [Akkermansia sp.]